MTDNKEHLALLEKWKERLGLHYWTVILDDDCTTSEMDVEAVGQTTWQEVSRTARIQIIDPACYGERVVPFDYELTLVHELLHLTMCFLADQVESLQERVAHQLIDDLAKALIEAQRDGTEQKKGEGAGSGEQ